MTSRPDLESYGFVILQEKQPDGKQTLKIRSYPLYRDQRIKLEHLKNMGFLKEDVVRLSIDMFCEMVEEMDSDEVKNLVKSIKELKTLSISTTTI